LAVYTDIRAREARPCFPWLNLAKAEKVSDEKALRAEFVFFVCFVVQYFSRAVAGRAFSRNAINVFAILSFLI
jgi:hypothetical protein